MPEIIDRQVLFSDFDEYLFCIRRVPFLYESNMFCVMSTIICIWEVHVIMFGCLYIWWALLYYVEVCIIIVIVYLVLVSPWAFICICGHMLVKV